MPSTLVYFQENDFAELKISRRISKTNDPFEHDLEVERVFCRAMRASEARSAGLDSSHRSSDSWHKFVSDISH